MVQRAASFGRYLTHAYLNMIHAGYQAWFTQENARIQLGCESQTESLGVDSLAQTVDTIVPMIQLFWDGQNIWDDAGQELLPEAAEFVRHTSAELVANLQVTADEVYSALHYSALSHDAGAQQILVTAHARYAYGRDQYVQGLVAYGEAFKMPDVAAAWKVHLEQCQSDLAWTHHLLLKAQAGTMGEAEIEQLFDRTLNLPGVFRSQVQDYNILLGQHAGEITFDLLAIPQGEALAWTQLGFAPEQAAYWHAYGISPAEAQSWIPAGFSAPGLVVQWRDRGFSPEAAVQRRSNVSDDSETHSHS